MLYLLIRVPDTIARAVNAALNAEIQVITRFYDPPKLTLGIMLKLTLPDEFTLTTLDLKGDNTDE